MKRIQLRSARRQEADNDPQKPEPKEAIMPPRRSKKATLDERYRYRATVTEAEANTIGRAEITDPRTERTARQIFREAFNGDSREMVNRGGERVTLNFQGSRVYDTREQAFAAVVSWFRRPDRTPVNEAPRLQEFGNHTLCTGSLRAESQTAYWQGGQTRLDALLLFPANANFRPHYLGHSCETGEPFIFVDIPAACAAARHIAGTEITDPGTIPSFYDNRFLQVTREHELTDPSREPYDFDVTFFAQVRVGQNATSTVMITVEMQHFMGNWEAHVFAWVMCMRGFVPTAFEKAGAALSNLSKAFKRIGGGGRDLRRAQEVRFVKRPGRDEWIDSTLGEAFSLCPSQYDI